MSESAASTTAGSGPEAKWRPLTAHQRRVLGTLMEKSKTTPDAYPLTINSLTTGCNQKNNRSPLSNLSSDQVERLVDELRQIGALGVIQGSGRTEKIRHYAYEWLGISKLEAAVMTELLLRGEQTLGELRGRAARMEPSADLAALQQLTGPLIERGLMIELSSPGRGQLVSHNLYPEWELRELQQRIATTVDEADAPSGGRHGDSSSPARTSQSGELAALRQECETLRGLVEQLQARVATIEQELHG